MSMCSRIGLLVVLVLRCAFGLAPVQAQQLTTFSFGGFGDGTTVTVSFIGTDLNADGAYSTLASPSGEVSNISVSFSGGSIVPSFTDTSASGDLVYIAQVGLAQAVFGFPINTVGDGVLAVSGANQSGLTELGSYSLTGGDCNAFGGYRALLQSMQCASLTYTPYISGSPGTAFTQIAVHEPVSFALLGLGIAGLAVVRRWRGAVRV